ncbi:MAG: aminopeptidase P family protein, partial [Desulfovibrio sp.]|nr:aminopeptidase P family protein [Desulfovibrio sp.]
METAPSRPEPEYRGRRARLRELLVQAGFDALLVTQPANRF